MSPSDEANRVDLFLQGLKKRFPVAQYKGQWTIFLSFLHTIYLSLKEEVDKA